MVKKQKLIASSSIFLIFILFNSMIFVIHGTDIYDEKNFDKNNELKWDLKLNFNEYNGSYAYLVLGEAIDANDGNNPDKYDKPLPPHPMKPYIRTWFNDNLSYPFDNLREDIRVWNDTYKIWNLSIEWTPLDEVSSTNITISWDVNDLNDCEYKSFFLYDSDGTSVLKNMLLDSSYSFICDAILINNFKIIGSSLINIPPLVINEEPQNGSIDISRPPTFLNFLLNDEDSDLMNVTIKWFNHSKKWEILQSYISVGNGLYGYEPLGNDWIWGNTTYTWSVNVTDNKQWTNRTYTFTTGGSRFDVNNNNIVNFQDAGIVWVHRTSISSYDGLYDVNQNGVVNFQDAGLVWVNRD